MSIRRRRSRKGHVRRGLQQSTWGLIEGHEKHMHAGMPSQMLACMPLQMAVEGHDNAKHMPEKHFI